MHHHQQSLKRRRDISEAVSGRLICMMWAPEHLPASNHVTLGTLAIAYELMRIIVVVPLQRASEQLRRSVMVFTPKLEDTYAYAP
jgi:hypothetical protein